MDYSKLTKKQLIEILEQQKQPINKNSIDAIYESPFIDKKLVSINHGYYSLSNGSKIKNKEAKDFQKYTYDKIIKTISKLNIDNTKTYKIHVEMFLNLQNSDVDNRFKFILDVVENAINSVPWDHNGEPPENGFNDKQFLVVSGEKFKVRKNEQGFKFYIYEYETDLKKSLKFDFVKKSNTLKKVNNSKNNIKPKKKKVKSGREQIRELLKNM